MKNLLEVSKIISKKKIRKIEIFDSAAIDNKGSKFTEFYEALMADRFKNDRDAASLLYNCSPTHDKYRQLKSRFRKRLMNTLFFIDQAQPNVTGYDRAHFSCHRDWTLVKILMSNGATTSAEELARQVLLVGLRFKFSDIILNCSRILRQSAAAAGDEKSFVEYDGYIKEFTEIFLAEIRSEELHQRVLMAYGQPVEELEGIRETIQGYCDALVSLSEIHDSPVVFYNMFLVWTYQYELLSDYENMLLICAQAEQYIDRNPNYLQEDNLATFQLKKMAANLHLRDFKNGKITAERSLQIFEEGSEVWFNFMEYYLLTALHTDNFIHGAAVFIRARSQSKFKKLDSQTREKWRIYEAYLNYFIEKQLGQMEGLKEQLDKTFRLQRFLKDDLIMPKELRVLTVHLLVGQILFLLDRKSLPEAAEAIDNLRSIGKYFGEMENYRMLQFIKLMQLVLKANFRLHEVANTEKYYENLVNHPFSYRGKLNELEVIPFEKLWNHVLTKL
ncbi:MAG: hypothetical protein K9J37_10540 [Saprospiraceae bacterium]|nr:hypothetical protein [Saprospiraceae bacterium]MCF8250342.1 hypothetical protein [Saprospiraceae bacterium]MCF8281524.1 hypothetical protein [Bacteroidales bacterium]MCF8312150.1 hypothetical protein [Saprospiraceae bacterium]MCF8442202.1 hypothetical protein [Saprospiraceae bacterium]